MENKWASRKLWAFVGTVLVLVGTAAQGSVEWSQIIWPVVSALMAFLGVTGAQNILSGFSAPKQDPNGGSFSLDITPADIESVVKGEKGLDDLLKEKAALKFRVRF